MAILFYLIKMDLWCIFPPQYSPTNSVSLVVLLGKTLVMVALVYSMLYNKISLNVFFIQGISLPFLSAHTQVNNLENTEIDI